MGLLKQKSKIIIHPDNFDNKGLRQKPDITEIRDNINEKLQNTDLSEDDIVNSYILNDGKKARNIEDNYILPSRQTQTVEELPKFDVGYRNRVQIDSDRVSMKCPKCKCLHAFTARMDEIVCCGVTYFK